MIQVFLSGPLSTNAYVVSCSITKKAAVIDPAPDSAPSIVTYVTENQLELEKILLTHSHWDHIADTAKLKAKFPQIAIYISTEDAYNLESPGSDGLPCWLDIPSVTPDHLIKEGDNIAVGTLNLTVIETPGHTPGGVCFYCAEKNFLFSGDTFFKGSIGTLSLPTARPTLMWKTLKKLSQLPPETRVFPGHGPSTTIGSESWLSNAEQIFH